MARDSSFYARVDAVGKGSKVMISDEVGLNANIRAWYASVRVVAEVGQPGWTIYMGGGSTTQIEDVPIGRVYPHLTEVKFEPSLFTVIEVERQSP